MTMDAVSEHPVVSVLIPVFNGEQFLSIALESVLSQTYSALEIIAVDDGSTDDSLSILEHYASLDGRLRVIRQPNAGVANARNNAIAASRGEFIAPLDADDIWQPNKIEVQLRRMLQAGEKTGIVYGSWVWIDSDGKVLDRSPAWDVEGNAFEALLQINFIGNASVPLFRRHCVEEAGGYNETLVARDAGGCEDLELLLRIAARYQVAVVPEVILGYRRRPGSMSTARKTMWRSHQSVLETMREVRPNLDPRLCQRAANQFALYLAGLAFWSGKALEAFVWVLRSGLRLPLSIAPYVLRMLLRPKPDTADKQTMRPGVQLDKSKVDGAILPYNEIYRLRPDRNGRMSV